MLPSFIVIGASKCGTTSVCDILSQHPDVFITEPKEPHFFQFDIFDDLLPWYEELFDGAEPYGAAGEGSVSYTLPNKADLAAARIQRLIPGCRLIYMVRHPIRRLESDWKMRSIEGQGVGPLSSAVYDTPDLIGIGAYWKQLSIYRRYFPDEQILVCFLEDFSEQPAVEIRRILHHIGVRPDSFTPATWEARNSATTRRRSVMLRKLGPLYSVAQRLKRFLPAALTEPMMTAIERRGPDPQLSWDEETHDHVVAQLRGDTRKFLQHFGKSESFWDLEATADLSLESQRPRDD